MFFFKWKYIIQQKAKRRVAQSVTKYAFQTVNNYRGITLNSFTILCNRLATICEQENIYCKEQGGGGPQET